MIGVRIKIERKNAPVWHDLPRYGRKLLLAAVLLSLLFHAISYLGAIRWGDWGHTPAIENTAPVKIRVVDVPKDAKKAKDDLNGKKILETPQVATKPPKEASYVGPQEHAAKQETKLARKLLTQDKALDPGVKGRQDAKDAVKSQPTPKQMITGPGTLAIPGAQVAPRNNYEKLLPNKETDVFGTPGAGYAEYIDAKIPEGDRIDMNTTTFRYISYFTGMRKAIELVWIYPREAIQRGLQGEVLLEIVIEKDGRVSKARVAQSSGFAVLDENMLQTIKLASPFAPLPKGWKKDRILVTGAFHYILSYGAH